MPNFVPNYVSGAVFQLILSVAPTAPASTSAFAMQGIGGLLTPVKSGTVLAFFTAAITATATTVNNGIHLLPYYGMIQGSNKPPINTAGIPNNAIALNSTPGGSAPKVNWSTGVTLNAGGGGSLIPVTVTGIARNLILGQQYWFDLAAESIQTASDNQLTQVAVTLVEL